jgi:YidC/Oxa1 family membrane protein insertase
MQARQHLIFIIMVLLLLGVWFGLRSYFTPEKKDPGPVAQRGDEKPKKAPATETPRPPAEPAVTPDDKLLPLGEKEAGSKFNLYALLDPHGGGVRSLWMNKFEAADDDGRPAHTMLELVPDALNRQVPSFLLYHFAQDAGPGDGPLDALGHQQWEVVKKNGKSVFVDTTDDGRARQQVTFRATAQGVTIRKTFSLTEGDYHLGLTIDLERPEAAAKADAKEKKPLVFRYQLAGAKGLPVEGKWYTHVFRNAYIGQVDAKGSVIRDLQELQRISLWGGGNTQNRTDEHFIRYAGVAVQYFASVIVVDTDQVKGQDQKFLKTARPTLETAVFKGRLKASRRDNHMVLVSDDGRFEETIFVPADMREVVRDLEPGEMVAVVYRLDSYDPRAKDSAKVALSVRTGSAAEATQPLWEDDITVRVATEPIELKPGDKVTHRYLLYHGPVKPSLLAYLRGDRAVNPQLVDRYAETLGLNKMIDYPSEGIMGTIGRWTLFSPLVTFTTNLMHRLLGWLSWVVPIYGVCIILLTVMVRGLMFPLSRKQAIMSVKMQALAPEIKKLSEKYKDDHQALGRAQMELWRKHGVNPLGSCWVLLLQMPIFMGLYYALQESIQFRLAPFVYIENLAAPDMLYRWGTGIPILSRAVDYGGLLYLGPYLNLLPIIAVALMMVQQKMMTPPPADEQQAMQQKMMKYMMIFFGLMFYKVAAGLCVYFIASSLWGFAERKLLPKAKTGTPGAAPEPATDGKRSEQITTKPGAATAVTTARKPGRNKRKDRIKPKEEEPATGLSQMRQRLSDWWTDLLEKARKK